MNKIILASKSPRRQELLRLLGVDFEVVLKEVDEAFPPSLQPIEAVRYIAAKKAEAFDAGQSKDLVITADTIVVIDNEIIGKPIDALHAFEILSRLSGKKHQVITAVALLQSGRLHVFHEVTEVYFRNLSADEIDYYITHYKPFDKAGAYGIQEWIGVVAIDKIVGSYTNVVGLPTARLSAELRKYM